MAFAVATMKKLKVENLKGLERHNQRETERHSNQDIDPERTHLNYDLVNHGPVNYQRVVMDYIDENRNSSRAVRKDAVVADEWIISSDQDFFKSLSEIETKRFFVESRLYFSRKFGASNIRYATVHMDESTPHMHMGIVPLTKDGRLSSKQMFDRNALKSVQSEFPKYMQSQGFNLERGHEDGKRKSLTVKEFKQAQERKTAGETELKRELVTTMTTLDPNIAFKKKDGHVVKMADDVELFLRQSLEWLQKVTADLLKRTRKRIREERQKLDDRKQELDQREESIQKREEEIVPREKALTVAADNLELAKKIGATPVSSKILATEGAMARERMTDEQLGRVVHVAHANGRAVTSAYDRKMLLKAADSLGVTDQLQQAKKQLETQQRANTRQIRARTVQPSRSRTVSDDYYGYNPFDKGRGGRSR